MLSIAVVAFAAEVMSPLVTAVTAAFAERSVVVMLIALTVSSLPAPTWKAMAPASPARMFRPLKVVLAIVRVISWASCWYSASRLARSSAVLVALADCTASSRMRWAISPIWPREASAVCASEMPSLALRIATFMPRIWVFIRSAIARPAASSLALFTRRPLERRCTAVASEFCVADRLRCAFSDIRLVLMIEAMFRLLESLLVRPVGRAARTGLPWRVSAHRALKPPGGGSVPLPAVNGRLWRGFNQDAERRSGRALAGDRKTSYKRRSSAQPRYGRSRIQERAGSADTASHVFTTAQGEEYVGRDEVGPRNYRDQPVLFDSRAAADPPRSAHRAVPARRDR